MIVLGIDTSETSCSLALLDHGKVVAESLFDSNVTHSRILMDMIDRLLVGQAGLRPEDVDGFVVARGPGSFTGVRIGISVVKGMAFAAEKPVAGVSSLDGLAWQFSVAAVPVCAMMDAKRGEVYTAVYRFGNGRLVGKSSEKVTDPLTAIRDAGHGALFCGSGAKAYQELIREKAEGSWGVAPLFQNTIRASALCEAALCEAEQRFTDPASITPVYLRKSDAEINFRTGM